MVADQPGAAAYWVAVCQGAVAVQVAVQAVVHQWVACQVAVCQVVAYREVVAFLSVACQGHWNPRHRHTLQAQVPGRQPARAPQTEAP